MLKCGDDEIGFKPSDAGGLGPLQETLAKGIAKYPPVQRCLHLGGKPAGGGRITEGLSRQGQIGRIGGGGIHPAGQVTQRLVKPGGVIGPTAAQSARLATIGVTEGKSEWAGQDRHSN